MNYKSIIVIIILFSALLISCTTEEVSRNRTVKYESGQIKEQFTLIDIDENTQVKDGEYKSFYQSGNPDETGMFDHDTLTGLWVKYYDSKPSVKLSEGNYLANEKDGIWHYWVTPDSNLFEGDTASFVHPHPAKVISYKKGVLDGVSISYYHDGSKADSIGYLNGRLNGKLLYFYPNGAISSEVVYTNGKPQSSQKFYDEAGNLVNEVDLR